MWFLYLKEIKTWLSSLVGYIFLSVFLIITGLFIWVFPNISNVLYSGQADLYGLFSISRFLFLLLIPAITMRSFAEEKKSGTLELLFTKPLTDLQIIFAKFLSSLTLLIIALIPTLVYIISVYKLGNPQGNIDMGSTWGSYLGLILLGATFISIGIFASSLTSNQIVAFLLAAIICFLLTFAFEFLYGIESIGAFGYYLKALGIDHHYTSISQGVIDSRDVLYFGSIIFIFLFSTKLILKKRSH